MYVLQIYMIYWADEVQLVDVGRSYFTTMDMFHIFHPKNSKIGTIFTSYTCAFLLSKDAGVVLDKFLAILRYLDCKFSRGKMPPKVFSAPRSLNKFQFLSFLLLIWLRSDMNLQLSWDHFLSFLNFVWMTLPKYCIRFV